MDNITKVPKRRYHVTPSLKQIKALQLVSQGYSKRRAMIEAGYSMSTVEHAGKILTNSRAAKQIEVALKAGLEDAGLTTDFMVKKFVEWMNAKKKDDEDYGTQQRAYKYWEEIMKPKGDKEPAIKRSITFEDFVNGDRKVTETVDETELQQVA